MSDQSTDPNKKLTLPPLAIKVTIILIWYA